MAWNADGTFSRSYDWTDEAAAGNNISSTKFDTENETFRLGIQNCINKDGKNAPSTDLPMGGNKHTNVGDATARTHYPSVAQVQDCDFIWGGSAGGTATALTITPSPAITAYTSGQMFVFTASLTNTGATTINVNSVGAKNIYVRGAACTGGEIVGGQMYAITYDGTRFHLIGFSDPQYAFNAYLSGNQSIPNNSATTIQFDTEDFDEGSVFTTASYKFTAPIDGIYNLSATVALDPGANNTVAAVSFLKNGATTLRGGATTPFEASGTYGINVHTSTTVKLSGTDYVVARVTQNSGGAVNALATNSSFSGHLVGIA